jgi:uncharacterized protein (TIGR03000 family)
MFWKTFAFGGTLLVAAALIFMTPGTAAAQRRVGFRAAVVAPRAPALRFAPAAARPVGGGYYGAYRAGVVGGYRYNPYHGVGHPGWYHQPYYGYGWGTFYPYYSSYGGYADDSAYYYDPYASYYTTGYSDATAAAPTYPYHASPYQAQPKSPAHVTVTVPESAQVWFDGAAMTSTGRVRQFVTQPLEPGRQVTYWIRARWSENGQNMNQIQPVEVTAGGDYQVSFPAPPRTGR